MKFVVLNILCEGQTEELFVKEVLKPYLAVRGIIVKSRLLMTNVKLGVKGGLISYAQAKRDLAMWVRQSQKTVSESHYFSTMFDLYALPDDFPGYERVVQGDVYAYVRKLEAAFYNDCGIGENFIPYIQVHEFEALVLCGLDKLKEEYPDSAEAIDTLNHVLNAFAGNPEAVDSGKATAPSKRIINVLDGQYHYDKSKSGMAVTKSVGIDTLRARCRHFDDWISRILSRCVNIESGAVETALKAKDGYRGE